jgi:signal transduction histidine kinase
MGSLASSRSMRPRSLRKSFTFECALQALVGCPPRKLVECPAPDCVLCSCDAEVFKRLSPSALVFQLNHYSVLKTQPLYRPNLSLAFAGILVLLVFAADIDIPDDDISICFAYTLPILLGVFSEAGSAYLIAAASTILSIVALFIEPPDNVNFAVFLGNRVIAIIAQWLVAYLIEHHKRSRVIMQALLATERLKAESGRRFVRILTHEIVTALTSIEGHSYRLTKLAPTLTPEGIVARSEKIRDAASRLDTLVSRIQAASEVDNADLVVSREWIDTEAFFASIRRDYEGDPDVRLELRVDQTELYGDCDWLRQAVSNLISNALKYSPKPAHIAITVARSAITGGMEIAIADKGRGIPADELERVLEPYYRARNAGGVRGLGLGLHLVKHFVEAHGGQVRIESQLASGTRVSLHFPI